jgi:hypothetical protein
MLPVNETVENSVISTCLSVAYIDLKNWLYSEEAFVDTDKINCEI